MPPRIKKQRKQPAPAEESGEESESGDERPCCPLYSAEEKEQTELRFAIGDEVACCMGDDEWLEGRVVRQFYRQKAIMPKGYFAAYQVKLDDGRLIFAPRDHDDFIGVRLAAKEAAWDVFFTNAVAAGHITQLEVDTLSDALAETTSAGARRELLEEQIDEACGRALLLWVPSVLATRILSMAGARGVVRAAQACSALRDLAAAPEVWEGLLARRHALVGAASVGEDVPQGPVPGHKKPPYSEPESKGVLAAWQERLAELRDASGKKGKGKKGKGKGKGGAADPKALYVEMHTTAQETVIGRQCASLTCNLMYRGRLTPRGELDICSNPVGGSADASHGFPGFSGRNPGPGLACGVRGCAASFCGECVGGGPGGLYDSHTDTDKAGNQPWRMETCSVCGVSVCEPHARTLGLMSSCDVCDLRCCVDCLGDTDIEPPIVTCAGQQGRLAMLPCRKRVCSKHVSVCVVVSPKANLEPPTKFQIIPWQALGCAAESDGELKAALEMITSAGRRDGDGTLAYKLMCNECAPTWEARLRDSYERHEGTVALIAELDPRPVPLAKLVRAMPRKAAAFAWAVGSFELVDRTGARGWLSYGMCERKCLSGSITFFGTAEADAAVPATPDARGKAVAKFFAGLGGGWLAQGGKESNESFYPTELMEPFAPRGDQVKGTTGGAAAASEAARTTRPGKERAQPRAAGAACASESNELLPGLELGAEAAPGDLSYGGYSNLGAVGTLRLWQVRGADGQPSGLLKGALTFPGKEERHFHFTAFRHQSEAARVNSAYTDAELAGAAAREQRRLVRMAKERSGGFSEYWRSAPRDEEEDAAMQAALAAQGAGGEGEGASSDDDEMGSGSSFDGPPWGDEGEEGEEEGEEEDSD